ncbi:MAG: hypothetical protein LUH21_08040 [Clostridiales bacterium]|nr:hypothetical protein [Clostridiales bacterium]
MTGFPSKNIKYMRKFAASWSDFEIVQQIVEQLKSGCAGSNW